ncbi:ABC transporter substrate-binding protein [Vogesella sp. LIG4]|uniref:substrate-binding periplasmic protein n=1 Tax=Vogesella sp. LIG4 TaxID=1192162 RepID=UPI00081FA9D9|nr:transporter substrate-binding domain-containing protein [Vogesella sp. LIG4]SCK07028.1 amino acid ABC transporter substrate-binding protein, PAAT family [Vogesella sp. LIG4]
MPLRHALALAALLAVHAGAMAQARTVTVAFGESLEPYVMPQQARGIEVDIIREALQNQDLRLKPVFLAQKRLPYALGNKGVDAVATMLPNYGINGAYSEPYIQYLDKAITLQERNLNIAGISDLARFRVLGFPLASRYLGEPFHQLTRVHPAYSETGNQLDQNRLLYRGSVDVVVADVRIFNYMNRRMLQEFNETPRPVQYHDLFPHLSYHVLFRSEQLRNTFNAGLRQLQHSGRQQQIIDQYDAGLTASD